jgi:phosphohistidine phosphatase SixA
MNPIYLVRHAKAGDRGEWRDDDRLRPLSKAGRRQAEGLARAFHDLPVARIVSSPHVRCVETVRPLAHARGLPIVESESLSEGAALEDALALLESSDGGCHLFCSHGDVIPAIVLHLADNGMAIDGERAWKKGSTWVLERGTSGAFTRGSYLAPAE